MKNFIATSVLAVLSTVLSFAQLNITGTNSTAERFYKDQYCTVTWNGGAFMMNTSDPQTGLTLSFTLGTDKASALTSLKQLSDWQKSVENKTSITIEDDGVAITIYKQDNLVLIVSTGDAEFIRKEYARRLSGALIGTVQYAKKEATPRYCFIQRKALENSYETIWHLTDPKYISGNYDDDPAVIEKREQERKESEAQAVIEESSANIEALKENIKEAKKNKDKAAADSLSVILKKEKGRYQEAYNILNPQSQQFEQ